MTLPPATRKRAAIYARVSTRNGHQDPETQLLALRQVAERAGWEVVEEYVDHGISGSKGRDKRPAFDRMLKDAARRKFDVLAAWSVDRLGRSLQDLVAFLAEIHAYGIDLYLHVQGLDTTTPGGKALFQMLGVFAEFERAIIQERVCAGLAKARAKGKRLGRPFVKPAVEQAIRAGLAAGKGQLKVARELGVGVSTVRRVGGSQAIRTPKPAFPPPASASG
jgi:DNA invertase Pin-like site-specific DNA recombinase